MSEQAQVGDTVRLTIVVEGKVIDNYGLNVRGYELQLGPNRTIEILSRADSPLPPPLPSEPGTWWLGKFDTVWHVGGNGVLLCSTYRELIPAKFGPFRQLVLK